MSKSIEIIKEYIFLRVIIPLYMILSQNQEKLQFKAIRKNVVSAKKTAGQGRSLFM